MSIKALLTKILTALTLTLETVDSAQTTVGANSNVWLQTNVQKTGKKPIALVGYYIQGSGNTRCLPYANYLTTAQDQVNTAVYNVASTSATVTIRYHILYQKA